MRRTLPQAPYHTSRFLGQQTTTHTSPPSLPHPRPRAHPPHTSNGTSKSHPLSPPSTRSISSFYPRHPLLWNICTVGRCVCSRQKTYSVYRAPSRAYSRGGGVFRIPSDETSRKWAIALIFFRQLNKCRNGTYPPQGKTERKKKSRAEERQPSQ